MFRSMCGLILSPMMILSSPIWLSWLSLISSKLFSSYFLYCNSDFRRNKIFTNIFRMILRTSAKGFDFFRETCWCVWSDSSNLIFLFLFNPSTSLFRQNVTTIVNAEIMKMTRLELLSEIVSKLPIIISLIKSERESPSSPPAPTR